MLPPAISAMGQQSLRARRSSPPVTRGPSTFRAHGKRPRAGSSELPGTPCLFQFPRPDLQHVFRHLQGHSGVNTAFVFKAGRSIAAGPARPIFHEPREKERCKPGSDLTAEQSGDEGRGPLMVWRFEPKGYSGVRAEEKTRLKGR